MGFTNFPHGVTSFGIPVFGSEMVVPIPSDIHYVVTAKATSSVHYTKLQERNVDENNIHITLAAAYAATTNNENDVVILMPESHSLSSTLTWANYHTHLVGNAGGRPTQFQRCRFGASADFTPVITMSSWGSTWANLRIMHGRGNAGNLVGVELSGHYNNWTNVHLYSPGSTTEGAVGATMMSLSCSGGNNYFEGCVFGVDTVLRSAANSLINFNTSGVNNVFKDCIFHMFQNASTPKLIWCASGAFVQNRWNYFDNCLFVAYSANWATPLTTAIGYNYSGGTGLRLIFNNCAFAGVTDLIADGYENNCQFFTHSSADGSGVGLPHVPQT